MPKKRQSFGDWIKQVGRANVARQLGVTYKVAMYWEKGRSTPRPDRITRIVTLSGGTLTADDVIAWPRQLSEMEAAKCSC